MAVPTGVGIKLLVVRVAGWPLSGRKVRNQLLRTEHNPPFSIPTCATWGECVWVGRGGEGKVEELVMKE